MSTVPAETKVSEPPGRGRRAAVIALLVLGCVLSPFAVTAIWLNNQVTDTDRYIRTIKPLADDADVQAEVSAKVTQALFNRVDVAAEARDALPPRADAFAAPLEAGMRSFTEDTAARFLESDVFQQLWLQVNRLAHEQLVNVLTGGGENVSTVGGKVVINLGPVVDAVRERLGERGVTVFDRIPESRLNTNFVVMDSEQLEKAQRLVDLLDTLALVLPLLVLACLAGAGLLSRNRRRTLLQASLGVAAGMLLLGLALTIGRALYLNYVAATDVSEDAAASFFDIVVHWLRIGLRAIGGLALLVAAGAFLTGPSAAAVAIRRRFSSSVDSLRGATGAGAGPTAQWVDANRKTLRILAIVIPVVIFVLWNAPTPAVLVVLVALALLALLVIEVIGRAPSVPTGPTPGSPV